MRIRSLLREPMLHFVLLGIVLFGAYHWMTPGSSGADRIVISQGVVDDLVTQHVAAKGLSAESRLHRHDEHEIDETDQRFNRARGGSRIEHDSAFRPEFADPRDPQGAVVGPQRREAFEDLGVGRRRGIRPARVEGRPREQDPGDPGEDSIEVGGTYNGWVVTLRDAQGELIAGPRNLQWDSQNPFVATIDASTGVLHYEIDTVPMRQGNNQLAYSTVAELSELVRTRKVKPSELTEMYLSRLKRFDSQLHFVVNLTEERARQQAKDADSEISRGRYRGPLHGIPWGAKDLLAVKGYPTTWGSTPYRDQMLDEDATVVRRLDDAGAVLVAGPLSWVNVPPFKRMSIDLAKSSS